MDAQPLAPGSNSKNKKGIRGILARFGGNRRQSSSQRPSGSQRTPRQSSRPLTDATNAQVQGVDSHEPMLNKGVGLQERNHSIASTDDSEVGGNADTNASTRPITPNSFLTSGSTSNLSHARSNATGQSHASTKPTTLLSQNSDGGANRIAQPSGSQQRQGGEVLEQVQTVGGRLPPLNQGRRDSANTTGSASQAPIPSSSSITFSALPPLSPATSLAAGSPVAPPPENLSASPTFDQGIFRYPQHTQPQTKNNPHPAGVPPDNASTLTLASSMAPSLRNYGGRQDEDASVRALPPSRRESDASLQSKWSSAVLSGRARPASLVTVGTTGSTPLKSSSTMEPEVEVKEVFVQASEVTPPSTPNV